MKSLIAALGLILVSTAAQADYVMTCDSEATDMCGEYSFPTQKQLEDFIGKCQSMGSVASEGQQCAPGGVGCKQSFQGMSVITYVYNSNPSMVLKTCTQTGGTPAN